MLSLELLKKIFEVIHFLLTRFSQRIWLTIISCAVIFLLLNHFKIFKINFFPINMKQYIENHTYIKHKIEMISSEALETIGKDMPGKVLLEIIPTINHGTQTTPNYWGYVSYLMEWDSGLQKVVNSREIRLKADKTNIPYDLDVSKKIHDYAMDTYKERSIYLSVNQMIADIDKVRMEGMWRTETLGKNGRQYYGNFDMLIEGAAFAFIVHHEEVVMQVLLLMDKEFIDNNSKDSYMSALRKARTEIQFLFSK